MASNAKERWKAPIETDGDLQLGEKASWKGQTLYCKKLAIVDGAKLVGRIKVPYVRPEPEVKKKSVAATPQAADDGP